MSVKKVPLPPPAPPVLAPNELDPSWGLAAVIDVETTGLDPEKHELIEIAVILFAFDRATHEIKGIVDEYVGQREPDRSIPREATAVHGLTKRMLKGKRLDYSRLDDISGRAEFYVAHNAEFEEAFCAWYLCRKPWYCSMKQIVWTTRTDRWQKLEKLLRRYHICETQTHRACDDARGLLTLLSLKNKAGDTFLHEMVTRGDRERASYERRRQEAEARAAQAQAATSRSGCLTVVCLTCLILAILALWIGSP
jgi:DNA polymerase-3 subunit epsilon